VWQSTADVGSVQTSKLPGPSLRISQQQPTSPTTVPANSALVPSSPSSPAATSVSSRTDTSNKSPEGPPASHRIRENLLDLTAANKAIASKHRLHPKTRSSVLQAVENWFGGTREPPLEGSSRVMAIHGRPGCGKTCLSAELCRRYSSRKQLVAGHFFHWKAGRPDHNRAVVVLLGLARRMCDLLSGYLHVQFSFITYCNAVGFRRYIYCNL